MKENIVVIGKNGAVDIPKEILQTLNVDSGDFINFKEKNNAICMEKAEHCTVDIPADFYNDILEAGIPTDKISDFLVKAVKDFMEDH